MYVNYGHVTPMPPYVFEHKCSVFVMKVHQAFNIMCKIDVLYSPKNIPKLNKIEAFLWTFEPESNAMAFKVTTDGVYFGSFFNENHCVIQCIEFIKYAHYNIVQHHHLNLTTIRMVYFQSNQQPNSR